LRALASVATVGAVLSRYLPSAPEVTKQVAIFLIAAIATAWVFSKVPALRSLRDDATL
jgi:hypothetical protein